MEHSAWYYMKSGLFNHLVHILPEVESAIDLQNLRCFGEKTFKRGTELLLSDFFKSY